MIMILVIGLILHAIVLYWYLYKYSNQIQDLTVESARLKKKVELLTQNWNNSGNK